MKKITAYVRLLRIPDLSALTIPSMIWIAPSSILIFFLIVWYIIFAPLFGEKLFRPRI